MNIYEKLQECRVKLAETRLKKSGKNTFAGYEYFELSDFLPEIQRLFKDHKLCPIVTFTRDEAKLQIIDSEKPQDGIEFTSPMEAANLKGAHPIQNAGAVQTYQRRYLYMAALEITEPDAVDSRSHNDKETQPQAVKQPVKPIQTAKVKCSHEIWAKLVDRMVNNGDDIADKIRATYLLTPDQEQFLKENTNH